MSFPFELDLTASTSADERPSLLRAATMMFPQPLSQIEGIGQDDEDTVMLFYAPDEQDEDDHDEDFEPYPYGEVETTKRLDVDHAWNAIVQAKELDAIEEQIYQDKIFAKAKAAAIAKQVEEDFEGEFEYELALDEWNTKAKPWFKFWTWKARQAEAGDTFDPTNHQYFNL